MLRSDPSDRCQRGNWLVPFVLIAVLCAPVAYVLSIGPARLLCSHCYISPVTYLRFKEPAEYAFLNCRLDGALRWYTSLFVSQSDPKDWIRMEPNAGLTGYGLPGASDSSVNAPGES